MKKAERAGFSRVSPLKAFEEIATGVRRTGHDLRNKFGSEKEEDLLKARGLFVRAKKQIQQDDPNSYQIFFGDDNDYDILKPFSKRGFHSRLFRFGNGKFVMKLWGGEASSPAMLNVSSQSGYSEYLKDIELLDRKIEEINARSNGKLKHFKVKPHTVSWVTDEDNSGKGYLLEFLPFLNLVQGRTQRKKIMAENRNLLEEAEWIKILHEELMQEYGVGMDFVDFTSPSLPITRFDDGSYHFVALDTGLEHSKEKGYPLVRPIFAISAAVVLTAIILRLNYYHRRR